jgi:8-oxo-dGTP pyrophosphatase MutT (NUDIX family)
MSDPASRRWSVRSARTLHANAWLALREYEAVAPTGAEAVYGLVHIKRLAIGVVPIDADGATLLVGQSRFPFGRYSWELPEGGGDPDEAPIETARRELAEEARLSAASWAPLLADVHLSNSLTDERAYAFLAWDLSPDVTRPADEVEELAVRRLPFAEAVRMAAAGEITDAFSLVMLFKTDHLARTGGLPAALARLIVAA